MEDLTSLRAQLTAQIEEISKDLESTASKLAAATGSLHADRLESVLRAGSANLMRVAGNIQKSSSYTVGRLSKESMRRRLDKVYRAIKKDKPQQ